MNVEKIKIPFVPERHQELALFIVILGGGLLLLSKWGSWKRRSTKAKAVDDDDIAEAKEALVLAYQNGEDPETFRSLNKAIKDEYGFSFRVDAANNKLIAEDKNGKKLKGYNLQPEVTAVLNGIN